MKLSEKLSFLRKEKGWSQEQLANKLSVSRQAIYKWEAGMAVPEIEKIKKLSNIFGTSLDELLNDEISIPNDLHIENSNDDSLNQESVDDIPEDTNDIESENEEESEEKQEAAKDDEEIVDTENKENKNEEKPQEPPVTPKKNKSVFLAFALIILAVAIVAVGIALIIIFSPHRHEYGDYITTVSATCETVGSQYRECSKCGDRETIQIPMLKHNEITLQGKEATCLEAGLTEGKKCSLCEKIILEQEEISATGHTEKVLEGKESTCTETGLTDGKECSVCGITIEEQMQLPMASHTYDNDTDSKCNACGFERDINCSHEETVTLEGFAPTCIKNGLTRGEKCIKCEEILVKQEVIPINKDAHVSVTVNGKEPTCTETGLTDGLKCSACQVVIIKQEQIPAKGHTEITLKGKDATCTETGLTDGSKCDVCKAILIEQEEIPALGHNEVVLPGKEATCIETGLTEGKICNTCGTTLLAQETIPTKEHTEKVVAGKSATCTEAGLTEGKICSVCSEELVKQTVINAKGHDYIDHSAKAETCTEKGWNKYQTCSRCEYTTYSEIPATGHSEKIVAEKAATCTETGLTEGKICSTCGTTLLAQEIIPAKGHTEKTIQGTAPTCSKTGLTDGITCSVCNAVIKAQETLLQTDHTYYNNKCTGCTAYLSESSGLSFTLNSEGTEYAVSGIGTCKDTDLVIPATYKGLPVTSIANGAFIGETSIKSVIIPDNVKVIEMNAFRECSYLETVDIGNGVEIIGGEVIEAAFYQCTRLKNLKLGNSLKVIPSWGFAECTSLENVVIPDSVEYIGGGAFGGCTNLSSVVIGSGLKECGGNPFSGCDKLLKAENGVYYVDKWLVAIDTTVENVVLKSNTVGIVGYGLASENLLSVTFNDNLKYVGTHAFYQASSIKSIELPEGVVSIGEGAFWLCTSLEKIVIPTTCTTANSIFYAQSEPIKFAEAPAYIFTKMWTDNLVEVSINSGTEIASETFKDCTKLTSVTISDTVTTIGANAFNGCTQISELIIPDSVTTIGSGALQNLSGMKNLVIGKGITSVEKGMLHGASSLENITIPFVGISAVINDVDKTESDILSAGEITFGYIFGSTYYDQSSMIENFIPGNSSIYHPISYLPTSLKNVTISTPCLIYSSAFQYVTLEELTIPKGVQFGNYATFGEISRVNFLGTLQDWCNINFDSIGSNPLASGADLYLNGELVTEVDLGYVPDYAFFGCGSITKATIDDDIGICAFDGCENLTSITIGTSTKIIYQDAFFHCPNLSQVIYLGTIDEWKNITFVTEGSYPTYCGADLYINGELVTGLSD